VRGRSFLGLLLIIVGIVFLLGRLGYVEWYRVAELVRFWPLLLIAFGVGLLFPRNTWAMPALLGLLVVAGAAYLVLVQGDAGTRTVSLEAGPTGALGISELETSIQFAAGELFVSGGATHVADLEARYRVRQGEPGLHFSAQGNRGQLTMSSPEERWNWSWFPGDQMPHQKFELRLNSNPVHTITANFAAGTGELDLSDLLVQRLEVDMAAGRLDIRLGMPDLERAAQTQVEIEMAAGETRLTVPAEAGVSLRMGKLVGSTNVERLGWAKSGDTYYSPNYDDAAYQIQVSTDLVAGKFDIHLR